MSSDAIVSEPMSGVPISALVKASFSVDSPFSGNPAVLLGFEPVKNRLLTREARDMALPQILGETVQSCLSWSKSDTTEER